MLCKRSPLADSRHTALFSRPRRQQTKHEVVPVFEHKDVCYAAQVLLFRARSIMATAGAVSPLIALSYFPEPVHYPRIRGFTT